MRLAGKRAIVTGGASGVGKATADLFRAQGAQVVTVDLAPDSHEMSFVADVSDPAQVEAYTQFGLEKLGGLDVLILNAGITGPNISIEDYPIDQFDAVMNVNVRAAWLGLRAAIPALKKRGPDEAGGSVILTSSIQGVAAMPGTSGYTTSKHALVGLAKGAALELAPFRVRVNAVHPGYVDTPMMDEIHGNIAPEDPQAAHRALADTVPMRRYASTNEVAHLMLYLASDEAAYSTGGSFGIDGGLAAGFTPS